jgi:hypothetical protein
LVEQLAANIQFMEIEGMENRGKDILAERRDKSQAEEPAGKWAIVLLVTLLVLFAFAYFVQPLHG